MAYNFVPDSVAVTGTASSANLIASSAAQSITLWQLIISGSAADATVVVTWTAAGTATTAKIPIGAAGSLILPYTGAAWAAADVGTAISFTAATTTTLTAYYTKGQGG